LGLLPDIIEFRSDIEGHSEILVAAFARYLFIKPRVNLKVIESFPAVATLPLTIALAEQNYTNMYQLRVSKTTVAVY
jgi:hypothetical protein